MALADGARLGPYEIVGPLGAGGMGEVYRARDTKLGRYVAIKILPDLLGHDLERRARFEREAQVLASLNHPGIVTLHSVDEANGIVFLTMELVEGRTLSELIPKSGFPLAGWLKIAIPLADAVAAAHQQGITHRDLKPTNVMVTSDGRLKVLDFGLAKLKEEAAPTFTAAATIPNEALTSEGHILGTVAYMSPEQAEGKSIDPRSDIFSLGIILYETATGAKPFKGDTRVSIISSIVKDTPAPIGELRRDLPRDVARIVKRCLTKDPEHRYQTAKDLRNDLQLLKDEIDSGDIQPSVTTAAGASARPGRRTLAAISVATLSLATNGHGTASASPSRAAPSRAMPS